MAKDLVTMVNAKGAVLNVDPSDVDTLTEQGWRLPNGPPEEPEKPADADTPESVALMASTSRASCLSEFILSPKNSGRPLTRPSALPAPAAAAGGSI